MNQLEHWWSSSPPIVPTPDLNAIEEAFSKLKITLKANEILLDILDVESLVLHACTAISAQERKTE